MVRSAEDVLDRLFGVGVVRAPVHGPRLAEGAREILGEIERGRSPDTVAATLGLPIAVVASRLAQLELDGYLVADGTGGYQRTSAQPPAPA